MLQTQGWFDLCCIKEPQLLDLFMFTVSLPINLAPFLFTPLF